MLQHRFRARSVSALATLGALALFGAARPGVGPAPKGAVTNHVIVISLDGLRPDALAEHGGETLRRLMREGSYSLEAQTIFPSTTLPSHTSMLTGVAPEVHGVTWNSDEAERGYVPVPTIFELARGKGFVTAAFFSKAKFHHLARPGSLDFSQSPVSGNWMATRTVEGVRSYLRHQKPSLLFVHLGEADYAGHSVGWMSFAYRWALRRDGDAVRQILRSADEAFGAGNYTVIVTSDHGGHGRTHGTIHELDMTIPWLAWGKGVQGGTRLPAGIRTMDTAATVLWLLGVDAPSGWTGRAVTEAFTDSAQLAAAEGR